MDYKLKFKRSVEKDLKILDRFEVNRIFNRIDNRLKKNPLSGKKLTGDFQGLLSYRVGDYRVIYAVLGNSILVLRIGHRKIVYK